MAEETTDEAKAPEGPSMMGFIIAIVVSSLIAVGGGGAIGMSLFPTVKASIDSHMAEAKKKEVKPIKLITTNLKPLKPILTNLAGNRKTWIRIEASLVLGEDTEIAGDDVLAGQISTDIVAYLRTLTLSHIEGASGFQHLREDLNERVAARSDGKVRELVVHSLIVE